MSGHPGVIIAGAAETDQLGKLPGYSTLQLHVEGALNAVADAGLSLRDIDGIATVSAPGPVQVANALGITPSWIDGTGVGGTSFLLHVRHAVAAIRAGYARTVLITHGESGRSRVGASPFRLGASSPAGQFEVPYGVFGPTTTFTIPVLRYMKEYGLTHEQLAYVAVAQRRWAAKNPRAAFRDPVTVEDVLASRMVAYPFHLLECCLVTDGGGALVVTSADRAASFPKPAVHVLGTGESSETPMISQMADFTESRAFRLAGRAAFAEARIGVSDVDNLMIYDAFAHVPIYGLEALGFVAKGEAGPSLADTEWLALEFENTGAKPLALRYASYWMTAEYRDRFPRHADALAAYRDAAADGSHRARRPAPPDRAVRPARGRHSLRALLQGAEQTRRPGHCVGLARRSDPPHTRDVPHRRRGGAGPRHPTTARHSRRRTRLPIRPRRS